MSSKETEQKLDQALQSGIIVAKMRRDNHTGCLVRRKKSRNWYARWMYHGKLYQQSTGTADKAAAKKVLKLLTEPFQNRNEVQEVIDAIDNVKKRVAKDIALPEIAIMDIWKTYNAKKVWGSVKERSRAGYERWINQMAEWMQRHGCRYMSQITKDKALAYLKERSEKLPIPAYNNHLSQFKAVWRTLAAQNAYHMQADVWEGEDFRYLKDTNNSTSERKPFTPAEIKAILATADDDMRMLTLVGLYTAMRLKDCATFAWEDIDMERKRMRVKTGKRGVVVTINIPQELYTALAEAKKTATGKYVNEHNANSKEKKLSDNFGDILDKCGIQRNRINEKGIRKSQKCFHCLRHSTATYLYEAGMSRADIARVLGDSVKMMDTYIDVNFGDVLRDVA